METKNRQIKKYNYYIQLCLFIFHLGAIIYFIFTMRASLFFPFLTNWSFLISTLYLFLALICDTSLYFFSSKNLEKLNHFIRNNFSNIAFPYCFMITIGFWIILLIGFISPAETFLKKGQKITFEMIGINVYVHLGITIIMVVDLFFNEREDIKLNWLYSIINTIIYIIYITSILIEKYQFDFYPYLFVKSLNIIGTIIVGFIIYGLLFGSILIYIALSNKINKKSIKIKEIGEDEKFISDSKNNENIDFDEEEK